MFCGNCGTEIKSGAVFCHNCGARMGGKSGPAVSGGSVKKADSFIPAADPGRIISAEAAKGLKKPDLAAAAEKFKKPEPTRKSASVPKSLRTVAALAACAAVLFVVIRAAGRTVVGVWKPGGGTGASSVGVNFSNPTESIANIVLGLAGDGRLVFAKDGTFLAATSSKKSVGLGLMTYEKKDKENLRLTLSMDVPVLGSISGSLDCKYRLEDRNTLVLTIYGNDIYLTRAKGEKPKEYVKAAKEADFLGNFFGSGSGFGEQIDQFGKDIKDGIKDNLDIDVDDALDDFKDGIEDNLDIDVDDALDDLKDGIEDNLDIDVDDTMDSLKEGLNSLFGK